jgi:hypothetical protein
MADTAPTTEVVITITPEGACWADNPRYELATMLRKLADQLDEGWYATFADLPEALMDSNGNPTGDIEVRLADTDPRTWAGLLAKLPDLGDSGTSNLRLDNGQLRVWLSRLGLADGEPFEHTVYVEQLDEDAGRWNEVGYFDGDVLDPHPAGHGLADAYELTRQAVALEARHGHE